MSSGVKINTLSSYLYFLMFKYGFYIIILLLSYRSSIAQAKETTLINITQEQGLPSNETYCVFKDSKGYIWVGTDQGVARMKSGSVEVFNNLPDNVVFKIREDDKGRVWFFSKSYRLFYFDNEKFYPFEYNNNLQKLNLHNAINDANICQNEILLDASKTFYKINLTTGNIIETPIWTPLYLDTTFLDVKTYQPGITVAEKKRTSIYYFKQMVINRIERKDTIRYYVSLLPQKVFQFYKSCTGKNSDIYLFFGVNVIKLKADGTYQLRVLKKEILCMNYNPRDNLLMIGFRNGGICEIDADLLSDIKNSDLITDLSISSITMDMEGGIWYSTLEKGLFYKKEKKIRNIINKPVSALVKWNTNIFFGTTEGLFKLNAYDSGVAIYLKKNKFAHNLQIDSNKAFVFSSSLDTTLFTVSNALIRSQGFKKLYFMNAATPVTPQTSYGYIFRQGSSIYKLADLKNYRVYTLTDTLPDQGNIFFDCYKNLLLGGVKNLYKYDFQTNTCYPFSPTNKIFKKGITYLGQMYNNIYTIGLRFGGLAMMKDTTILGIIKDTDGLLSNSIKYILAIHDRLWIATPSGISVVTFSSYGPLKYTITNLGENIGLNNCIIYQLMADNNDILAATSKGIYRISKVEQLLDQKPLPIPLYITNIKYYKGDTATVEKIILPYANNRLAVSFDALSYNSSSQLKYYYRLTNDNSNDTVWHSLSTNQIVLENLSPDAYELQIKAEIPSQKRSSAIQKLTIIVNKPWWQLNLVRIGAVLLFLLIVYLFYRWRISVIERTEAEKTFLKNQMTELEQTALRSQMNPHFIFNCLTSIQQLLLSGDREYANEQLVKFSRLIRKTLELSALPFTNIEGEIAYLTEYMELEQLRMPGQFDFSFYVSDDVDIYKAKLPNMMLQPIIENCIRHGIKHLQNRKGRITIDITKSGDCLNCSITDNGVGRVVHSTMDTLLSHKSYGMDIIRKRLKGAKDYDPKQHFMKIIDLANDQGQPLGTQVIIQLPYIK